MATSTVGKVLDVIEKDGKVWVQLDFTHLYYDSEYLQPADPSEYKEIKYKEREKNSDLKTVQDYKEVAAEVNIETFTPSGGG